MSTRRPLSLAELTDVLAPVGTPVAERTLSGGLFAAVQAVTLEDGTDVVVKAGQPDGSGGLLTYEQHLLRGEAALLELAGPVAGIPAPPVLHVDLTRAHVDVDVLVAGFLPGSSWDAAKDDLSPDAVHAAAVGVGEVLARLNTVTGDRFGYPAAASGIGGATWPEAFGAMVTALLDDAEHWGVQVDAGRVRRAVDASADALAEVTLPRLVHMDLWPGNVLLDPATGAVTGIVDFERGLFGDPLMDLVGHDPIGTGRLPAVQARAYLAAGGTLPLAGADAVDDGVVAAGATGAAGTDPVRLTPSAWRRLSLYRLYLTLIMTVEVVPRRYDWAGVDGYVTQLVANRATLLERLGQ